ncbi:MAG TPA: type II CRISPR RNA-guided endonuclease Cas9, partial [Saprospiraceae bacterium]|nr:type II CRISPR RNA-guided endonuclease Cas9 [Saprospiraceae bacterium]
YTADLKGLNKRTELFQLRSHAPSKQLTLEEVALVISEVNGNIHSSSGYLGDISDRSKELYFKKITVGQYLIQKLDENPHFSLKNKVFYRQDYLDEFERIWETQAKHHPILTPELKSEIRDIIIFYQRRLKSQKGLISFCEFESEIIEIEENGKKRKVTIGNRVCPRSSPLFQEFKIWQTLNNVKISSGKEHWERDLDEDEKLMLAEELKFRDQLVDKDVIKMLFPGRQDISINFKKLDGNKTISALYNVYAKIIEMSGHDEVDFSKTTFSKVHDYVQKVFNGLGFNTQILNFDFEGDQMDPDKHELYRLWHLLYSYEGDSSKTGNEGLINAISRRYGFDKEYAAMIANVVFQDDHGSLSAKAIQKILPFLKSGYAFAGRKEGKLKESACEEAGYKHSIDSLTKHENEQKELLPKLEILPKNSLRNPVVEKILNQMVNVINAIIDEYGKPDEVRIELARELKRSAKERESMTSNINKSNIEHERIRSLLINEFGLRHVSRNDIIRYKLYEELEFTVNKTLYSNTYIPREKLFSHEFDIDHIIPQSRLFDDSFSNKTIELKDVNIKKGNQTAIDFVLQEYGEQELGQYHARLDNMLKNGKISPVKYKKLKMKGSEIPQDFIQRDIRDTQYIAKKAKAMLETIVRSVVSTTGSITDRLRQDWQLIDVMKELNWQKYDKLGLTEVFENEEGHQIRRIKDWTKRNDHRHHAMDALTVAFTKRSHIQYLNNLNARSDKSSSIYGIEAKELDRNEKGKLLFKPPIPVKEFRAEAKSNLESILVSIKAKNKVMTNNVNKIRKHGGHESVVQLTPRGQLHNETIYGSRLEYVTKTEKVNAGFDMEKIQSVANKKYREALMKRLEQFENDPKLAFTGKNSITKNPVWIDDMRTISVPEKVKLATLENMYTIRKEISKDLKIEKVVDKKIRKILQERLDKYQGDANKAFSNLNFDPIWLNEEKGISIKRVTISGVSNAVALRARKDHLGNKIMDEQGLSLPVDFVSTSNNHHVAIFKDGNGNLQEHVVSFFEVVERVRQDLPVIDKHFNEDEGWQFLFSMKQNEYFVFPNEQTGFNPIDKDLLDENNYPAISQNLFRVQKIS